MAKKKNRSTHVRRLKSKKDVVFEVDRAELFSNIPTHNQTTVHDYQSTTSSSFDSSESPSSSHLLLGEAVKNSDVEYRAVAYIQLSILEGNMEKLQVSERKSDMKKTLKVFRDYLDSDLKEL